LFGIFHHVYKYQTYRGASAEDSYLQWYKSLYVFSDKEGELIGRLSGAKVLVPVARLVINFMINCFISLTFYFSQLSGVNAGIMSTNFSSCMIFVALLFYCRYGQKMQTRDILGSILIFFSVGFIAFGGSREKSSENE
jgi:drug/metabolite transporter (DMT)-like permease